MSPRGAHNIRASSVLPLMIERGMVLHNVSGTAEAARQLGVTQPMISHINRGISLPSERLVRRIAEWADVSYDAAMVASGRIPSDIDLTSFEIDAICVVLEAARRSRSEDVPGSEDR